MIEVNKGQQFQVQLSVMRSKDATTQQFLLAGCRDLAFNAVGKLRQYALEGFTYKDNILTATVDTSEYDAGVYSITARGRYLGEWWRAETVALFTVVKEGGVLPTETVAATANAVFSIREEFPSLMERVEKLETTPSGVTEEELAAVKKELNASISTNKTNIATNAANILTAKEAARKARIDGLLAYAHRVKARRDPWAEFLYRATLNQEEQTTIKYYLGNGLRRLIPIACRDDYFGDLNTGIFDMIGMSDWGGRLKIVGGYDPNAASSSYSPYYCSNSYSPEVITSASSSSGASACDAATARYIKRVLETCVYPLLVKTISMRGYDYDASGISLGMGSYGYDYSASGSTVGGGAHGNPACFAECIDFGNNSFIHCKDPTVKSSSGSYRYVAIYWSAITALGQTASVMIAENLYYRSQLVEYLKAVYPNTTWEDFDGILVRTSSDGYVDPSKQS